MIYRFLLLLFLVGCQSTAHRAPDCTLSGYSFCIALPEGFRATNEAKGPDFVIFNATNFSTGVGLHFYEGDYEIDATEIRVIENRGPTKLGQVEFLVTLTENIDSQLSIVLTRQDNIFPNTVQIVTSKAEDPKALLESALDGIRGCEKVNFYLSKCDA